MQSSESTSTEPSTRRMKAIDVVVAPNRGTTVAGVLIVGLLCAVCLGLAFQSGAYGPSTWLPLMIAVAGLALVVGIAGPPVFSGSLQKIILGLFALQAVWTAASLLWAASLSNAWEETNRTLFYAVTLMLVFTAVRWAGKVGLKALAASVTAVAGIVALVILVTLAVTADPLGLFEGGRLNYPVTYFNGLASLLMIGFWLALGMANGARCTPKTEVQRSASDGTSPGDTASGAPEPESRVALRRARAKSPGGDRFARWTQPLLLALAVVLLEVSLLPQSRGAFWAFFLVVPFFVILSPHRFRALVDLAIVVAPVVLFWGRLSGAYSAVNDGAPLDAALGDTLSTLGYSVAIVLGAWTATWLIERSVGSLRRRVALWIGAVLAVLAIFGATGGIIYADARTGGLDDYLGDRWQEFTADAGPGSVSEGSRFAAVGLNGRLRQWRVAAQAFAESPALGLGAQNFEHYWFQHRTTAFDVRQPHSQPMQLLSELGLPGLMLWVVFILAALVRAAVVRFRSSGWAAQAVLAAMTTATISWFIHSSADWLWQLAGVSLPAMMLLGGLIAAGKGAAEAPAPLPSERPARDRRFRRSWLARALAVLVAVVALGSAAFPYLSLRYSDLAAGSQDIDEVKVRVETAATLDPTSVLPFAALAGAHTAAASAAADPSLERVDQLRLAATAWEEAAHIEPSSWVCQYMAADTLLAAREAALAAGAGSVEELKEQARIYVMEARRLNPLSSQIDALEESLAQPSVTGSH